MADDTTLGAAVGVGDKISTDDLGAGTKVQRVKVQFGADGSATDASTASPLPVVQTGALPAGANAIGVVDTELPAAAALADAAANPTTPTVGAGVLLWNGATWDRAPGGATNGLTANLKALNGTTVDTSSGNKSAGTLRVTLATDQVQLTNALKVDGSAVTQPVSGTVTSTLSATTNAGATAKTSDFDTGAGTDTVTSFGIALPASGGAVQGGTSTNPVRTDPTGTTTQPVSGTVTATGPLTDTQLRASAVPVSLASAPSTAVTNAGTFAVQDSEKVADNAGFTDGTTKVLPAGFIFDEVAGTALTENDAGAARMDSKRAQVLALEDATTRGQRAAISAAGRLSVDASGVAVPITDNSGSLTVDAPVGTPAFVRLSDGSAAITTLAVSLATLPALTAGAAQVGTVGITPQTTGGFATPFHLISASTTNATNVKASAGQLFGWYIRNLSAGDRKVAFHNTAGSPTAGAGVVFSINLPAGAGANVFNDIGIPFATGIAITTVTGAADTDATAVTANDLDINLFYK